MNSILAIIIIRYLQKNQQTKVLLPNWHRILVYGMFGAISLLVLSSVFPQAKSFLVWPGHIIVFGLTYLILYIKEFTSARTFVNTFIPFFAVNFIQDLVKFISPGFYKNWDGYFETAILFSFVWMIALFVINNKQRKALEKEKLKTQEKEREIIITEKIKAELEVQVQERTAALTLQKEELEVTLNELKATQNQLIQSEKMASLGELTAGIAHEIQNPLNFVNNFSEVNMELIEEVKAEKLKVKTEQDETLVDEILNDIAKNLEKINHHGKRADAIVKGMLQHSRSSSGTNEPTDINALADEYLRLAYHGLRAKDKSFNAALITHFDEAIGKVNMNSQDMGRVILNLITNAFYVVNEKAVSAKASAEKYEPTVTVNTQLRSSSNNPSISQSPNTLIISVKDNGNGIPQKILDKIFQPFFTTKPTGQGTGLGLSLSYDIVKAHGGEMKVETKEGVGSEFIISLPI